MPLSLVSRSGIWGLTTNRSDLLHRRSAYRSLVPILCKQQRQTVWRSTHLLQRPCATGDGATEDSFSDIKTFTQSSFYKVILQGLVYTLNLAFIDAAYSGDWSRIDVISAETESWLQQLSVGVFSVHLLSTIGTASLNIRRNRPWLIPAIKTFGIGFLSLVQQWYEEEQDIKSLQVTPVVGFAAFIGALVILEALMHAFIVGSV